MARLQQGPPRVRFYHLSVFSMEKALTGIVGKAWDRGLRVSIVAGEAAHAQWVDDLLWREPVGGFVPHGQWNRADPARHPVLIGLEPDERNDATVLILAAPRLVPDPERFDLIIDFVSGHDATMLAASRRRYQHYRGFGCVMEYWTQTLQGGWQKKSDAKPAEG